MNKCKIIGKWHYKICVIPKNETRCPKMSVRELINLFTKIDTRTCVPKSWLTMFDIHKMRFCSYLSQLFSRHICASISATGFLFSFAHIFWDMNKKTAIRCSVDRSLFGNQQNKLNSIDIRFKFFFYLIYCTNISCFVRFPYQPEKTSLFRQVCMCAIEKTKKNRIILMMIYSSNYIYRIFWNT